MRHKQFLRTDSQAKRIISIEFQREVEEYPDFSWLGEYQSSPGPDDRTIDRKERGDAGTREYHYFVAANSPTETGNPESVEQDYQLCEDYNRGGWCFLFCQAHAVVSINGVMQTVTSGGLGGVESDSDSSYFDEIRQEQFDELRSILKEMGFKASQFTKAMKS